MKISILIVAVLASLQVVFGQVSVRESCRQPIKGGPCRKIDPRWGFDGVRCVQFNYGGCGGNENNFDSEGECQNVCFGSAPPAGAPSPATDMSRCPQVYLPSTSAQCRYDPYTGSDGCTYYTLVCASTVLADAPPPKRGIGSCDTNPCASNERCVSQPCVQPFCPAYKCDPISVAPPKGGVGSCDSNPCQPGERCVPQPCVQPFCPAYKCQPATTTGGGMNDPCHPNPCAPTTQCVYQPQQCTSSPCPQYACRIS